MYAYAHAHNPNPSNHNNTAHRGPHRFEVLIHQIKMDPEMLQGVFTFTFDGVVMQFTGLIKGDPAVMTAAMATDFHSWNFSNRNRLTIPEFKNKMERYVSGLAIVNAQ